MACQNGIISALPTVIKINPQKIIEIIVDTRASGEKEVINDEIIKNRGDSAKSTMGAVITTATKTIIRTRSANPFVNCQLRLIQDVEVTFLSIAKGNSAMKK